MQKPHQPEFFRQMIKWAREYPHHWEAICTPGAISSYDHLTEVIENLRMTGMESLIFVLFTVYRKQDDFMTLKDHLLYGIIADDGKSRLESVLDELKGILEEYL